MRWMKSLVVLSTVAVAAACGGDEKDPGPDRYDLSWMDTLKFENKGGVASALESGFVADSMAEETPVVEAPKPAATRPAARRTSTARSTSASSGTYRAPAPRPARTVVKRNTARDAAIGAAGGAVIGAVAGGSRHRVRGAVIGAAAGAVVGGIIGHTVDKKTTVVYE